MVYISLSHPDKNSVIIKVEGTMDNESLSILEEVYRENLESGKRISIDLGKISSVGRSGRDFLRQIQNRAKLIDVPVYIQMAIGNP
jgi:anti-anti-sigma regulatory factor